MGIIESLRFRGKVERACADFDRKLAKVKAPHCPACHDDPAGCAECPHCPDCGDPMRDHEDGRCPV